MINLSNLGTSWNILMVIKQTQKPPWGTWHGILIHIFIKKSSQGPSASAKSSASSSIALLWLVIFSERLYCSRQGTQWIISLVATIGYHVGSPVNKRLLAFSQLRWSLLATCEFQVSWVKPQTLPLKLDQSKSTSTIQILGLHCRKYLKLSEASVVLSVKNDGAQMEHPDQALAPRPTVRTPQCGRPFHWKLGDFQGQAVHLPEGCLQPMPLHPIKCHKISLKCRWIPVNLITKIPFHPIMKQPMFKSILKYGMTCDHL